MSCAELSSPLCTFPQIMKSWPAIKHYLFGYFILDFIGSIPAELIVQLYGLVVQTGYTQFAAQIFILKVLRILRFARLYTYLFSFDIEVTSRRCCRTDNNSLSLSPPPFPSPFSSLTHLSHIYKKQSSASRSTSSSSHMS